MDQIDNLFLLASNFDRVSCLWVCMSHLRKQKQPDRPRSELVTLVDKGIKLVTMSLQRIHIVKFED